MEDIEEDDSDNEMPSSIIDLVQQNRTVTYDPQVEVDGKYVYQATVVRSLFGSNPLSKDRLRRVQGLSKFTESERANVSIDNSIMLGDPVLINVKNRLQIAQIKCIKKGNKKVKLLTTDELNAHNVSIDAVILSMESNDYIWNGDFLGETFISIGLECYAIQPTLKEVDGQIHFTFDKQLILDLNVGISVSKGCSNVVQGPSKSNPENSTKHLVSCFVCEKSMT